MTQMIQKRKAVLSYTVYTADLRRGTLRRVCLNYEEEAPRQTQDMDLRSYISRLAWEHFDKSGHSFPT